MEHLITIFLVGSTAFIVLFGLRIWHRYDEEKIDHLTLTSLQFDSTKIAEVHDAAVHDLAYGRGIKKSKVKIQKSKIRITKQKAACFRKLPFEFLLFNFELLRYFHQLNIKYQFLPCQKMIGIQYDQIIFHFYHNYRYWLSCLVT